MTVFWGKTSAGLAVVMLATALAGCQMVQGAAERLGCSAEVCTRDYPRPLFVDQPAGFQSGWSDTRQARRAKVGTARRSLSAGRAVLA